MSKSKKATKQSLKKVLSFVLSGDQPFGIFFFWSYCLIFAENSVMRQNMLGPLIC